MRHFAITIMTGLAVLAVGVPRAGAEGIWFSWHEFSGEGWADVFDGGLPGGDSDGGMGSGGPGSQGFGFGAYDRTQPGSLGASASSVGRSQIFPFEGGGMRVRVALSVSYIPSLSPGGDNPGGAAEGELSSIIEFVMPVDELLWAYQLRIRDTIEFEGSTRDLFENVVLLPKSY